MAFNKVSALALTAAAALLPSLSHGAPGGMMSSFKRQDYGTQFGTDKVRGVNLGGWFVLEPWITPSIFEATPENCVDEYTMSATLGKREMRKRMQKHWSSWITAEDFANIAAQGLNLVRIPVGYWSISPVRGDPYIQGADKWLAKAIGWAGQNNLQVMIDLHGAPGSQNGFDNSGQKGDIEWTQGKTVAQTLRALKKLRNKYASNPTVVSIELLNEPLGPELDMDTVEQFYEDGLSLMAGADVITTIHDAFQELGYWDDFGGDFELDTHHYEVFDSEQLELSTEDHISSVCDFGSDMAASAKPTLCGEWSGAMTDCAKWLNGRNVGARYDGTYVSPDGEGSYYIGSCDGFTEGSVESLSPEAQQNIGSFIQAQMSGYEKADGWIWWTWKTEGAPEWDFQALAAAGIMPSVGSVDTSICG